VRPVVVIVREPFVVDILQVCNRSDHPGVEHFATERAVEALDVGVLVGLAGLDVADVDLLFLAPVGKRPGGELRGNIALSELDQELANRGHRFVWELHV